MPVGLCRRGGEEDEMPTHPVPALVFPLLVGQLFHFVFSNKTKHDDICVQIRDKMVGLGLSVWQQTTNIPRRKYK